MVCEAVKSSTDSSLETFICHSFAEIDQDVSSGNITVLYSGGTLFNSQALAILAQF
jgi:hypothetical protein